MDLQDALVGGRQRGDLDDSMPHAEALDARPRPAAVRAERLRLLVSLCLEDEPREGREDARPSLAHEPPGLPVRLPSRRFGAADWNVDADGAGVGEQTDQGRRKTEMGAGEAASIEHDSEPFATARVEADDLHGRNYAVVNPL